MGTLRPANSSAGGLLRFSVGLRIGLRFFKLCIRRRQGQRLVRHLLGQLNLDQPGLKVHRHFGPGRHACEHLVHLPQGPRDGLALGFFDGFDGLVAEQEFKLGQASFGMTSVRFTSIYGSVQGETRRRNVTGGIS